jgi:hypothetical protein
MIGFSRSKKKINDGFFLFSIPLLDGYPNRLYIW